MSGLRVGAQRDRLRQAANIVDTVEAGSEVQSASSTRECSGKENENRDSSGAAEHVPNLTTMSSIGVATSLYDLGARPHLQ
jgi:hypothetical protein